MESKGNPYNGLMEIFKNKNQSGEIFSIGKVVAAAPLLIQVGDMPLEESDVLMSDFLVGKVKIGDSLLMLKTKDGQTIVAVSVLV